MPTNHHSRAQDDQGSSLREMWANYQKVGTPQTLQHSESHQVQKSVGMKNRKSPYDIPFIIERVKGSQEKFTKAKAAFEKFVLSNQGAATQEKVSKEVKSKSRSGGNGPSDSSRQTTIKWFVDECCVGAEILGKAIECRHPLCDTVKDATGIYRRMIAAFSTLKSFAGHDSQYSKGDSEKLSASEAALKDLGEDLYELCLDVDAIEGGSSSRLSFRTIESNSKLIQQYFSEETCQWSSWRVFISEETYTEIQDRVKVLIDLNGKVIKITCDAVKHCDPEEIRKDREALCQKLAAMQQTYETLICRLEFWECSCDISPPPLVKLRANLERVGRYVADALQALATIHIEEEDWRQKLTAAWTTIKRQLPLLEVAIADWAHLQLCSPPDFCRAAINRLTAYVQEALMQVVRLPEDRTGCETLQRQLELVECVHEELSTLARQAGNLKEFNKCVFDPVWWPIAQIRLLLAPCEEQEDPCVLTESQWKDLGKFLQTRFQKGAQPLQSASRSSHRPFVNTAYVSMRTDPSADAPQQENLGAEYALYYIETWKKLESLTKSLEPFVTMALKQRLETIVVQAQSEQQRLQVEANVGTVSAAKLVRGVNRYWRETYEALTAAYAITLPSLIGPERQCLADLNQQLPILNQQMKEKLDL